MCNDTTKLKEILSNSNSLDEFICIMIKNMIETLLKAELTEFLNYEKYEYKGRNSGNSRNGFYSRDYDTKYGRIENLQIPRDRNGEFKQKLIEPYKRRDGWLEDMIISMYASGASAREIMDIIDRLYGHHYSPQTVSNITDVALEEIDKWRQRPLKRRYSVLFIDATFARMRRDTVLNEAIYFIIGVDEDGYREVLDFFIGANESSTVWKEILYSLKQRGVEEVLLGVMDGLPAIEEAFLSVFPKADIQRCIVHVVRHSYAQVRKKDQPEFIEDLKSIYRSSTLELAQNRLAQVTLKWSKRYKRIMDRWNDNPYLFTYYKYPETIRRSIYTTNWIERFNNEVKRLMKPKEQFPTEEAAAKIIYYQVIKYNEKWSNRILYGFKSVQQQLKMMFEERYGNQ